MDTIEIFRFQLNNASWDMYEEETKEKERLANLTAANQTDDRTDYFKYTADISPLYEVVDLALDNVACVGGSWVAPKDKIAAGDWDAITALAAEAAALGY